MKKRIFISQPMHGKDIKEIREVYENAGIKLMEMFDNNAVIIDTLFETLPKGLDTIWFLGSSIKLLSNADLVYFTRGWERYRCCKIIHTVCTEYGVKVMYE